MGKYKYTEKVKKPLKRKIYIPLMAINCIVVGLIFLFVLLGVLNSINANSEQIGAKPFLLNPMPIIFVGIGMCILFAVIEALCRRHWEMKWWDFIIAGYLVPLVFWGITSLITLTNWWSNRNNDDAIVLKWMTLVMLIYIGVALVYRIIGHIIYMIFDRIVTGKSSAKKEKK